MRVTGKQATPSKAGGAGEARRINPRSRHLNEASEKGHGPSSQRHIEKKKIPSEEGTNQATLERVPVAAGTDGGGNGKGDGAT